MTTGVVLMAYGTPAGRDDILAYYTDIRRGRPPSEAELAELVGRYDALGGTSQMAARTHDQVVGLQAALDTLAPGDFRVALGTKHSAPTVEDAVTDLSAAGHRALVGLVLAPHYSAASVGQYHQRATAAAEREGATYTGIDSWARESAYVSFLAGEVRRALAALPGDTKVVFTAHSIPTRVVAGGDRYAEEVRATATLVAREAGLGPWSGWATAWQSAGRTAEPWLRPDIVEIVDELAASENDARHERGLLVCPCGFVADHLEVAYDLDIQAARRAATHGLAFARTASVHDDPAVMAALAARVIEAAGR